MPFQHVAEISAWLAGSDITRLELSGPEGVVRLGQEVAPATPASVAVRSAGVGVFLHRHPLSTAAFVAPGARVAAGQMVGLLQVGVLLMPVLAPSAGLAVGYLVPHGQIVGFGVAVLTLESLPQEACA